jgi:hypothetical protein
VLDDPDHSFFTPNSTFVNQKDEDILVLFLVNFAYHPLPIYDPWFSATREVNNTGTDGGNLYLADRWPSSMFCSEQHQFCNPNLPGNETGCTSLTGRAVMRKRLEADHGRA